MTPTCSCGSRGVVALLLVLTMTRDIDAQPRTDIVRLVNGDHITGEVVRLERGRLEFKTDDAGTIYFEWDIVAQVEAARQFEIATTDGGRILGSFAAGTDRMLTIVTPAGRVSLPMPQATTITAIGSSFWRKLDGSFDAGFSYTRSSGIAQLNLNSHTTFRRPGFDGRLNASITATRQDEGGRDDRGSLQASYVRYRWPRWYVSATGRFESNESLGLRLRSQIGGAIGPRIVNSNRATAYAGAGLALNDERGVDAEATQNIEATLVLGASYFTYDRPRTNLDFTLQYYPSVSNAGRHRLQLDAGFKRELWKDFFVALNVFDTFDSRPPNGAAETNDFGTVMSIGWSY